MDAEATEGEYVPVPPDHAKVVALPPIIPAILVEAFAQIILSTPAFAVGGFVQTTTHELTTICAVSELKHP